MLNLILNTPTLTLADRRRVETRVWHHSWGNLIRPTVLSTHINVCALVCVCVWVVFFLTSDRFSDTWAICPNLKGSWRALLQGQGLRWGYCSINYRQFFQRMNISLHFSCQRFRLRSSFVGTWWRYSRFCQTSKQMMGKKRLCQCLSTVKLCTKSVFCVFSSLHL